MTLGFDVVSIAMLGLCVAMAILNALKNGWRGWKGLILSASFIVFGVTLYLYKTGAPTPLVCAGCAVLLVLLGIDMSQRTHVKSGRNRR